MSAAPTVWVAWAKYHEREALQLLFESYDGAHRYAVSCVVAHNQFSLTPMEAVGDVLEPQWADAYYRNVVRVFEMEVLP